MVKTTLYLPEELKRAIEATAARDGLSESELIRRTLQASLLPRRPRPRPGIISGEPIAERVDELLEGFGRW